MFSAFASYIGGLFTTPPPPAGAAYGFRWQAGGGVPAILDAYDVNAGVAPGLYVGFPANVLDSALVDPFGRAAGGPGPVFAPPLAPSAAMTALITKMRANPPPDERGYFNAATPAHLADLSGFLTYTNTCLAIINATAAGAALLAAVSAARFSVFISPDSRGWNSTSAGGLGQMNTLTAAVRAFVTGDPMPAADIRTMIDAKYGAIAGMQARYNQLAADLNALPLYSLFIDQNAFQPNFLSQQFRFRGQRLTGQNLMNWLSPGGFAVFDTSLRTLKKGVQNVSVRNYFLLALIIVLYAKTPAGEGASAGVKFHVINEGDNVLGSAEFRPPAIGLAHELMHALHYTRGTSPGYDIGEFTTTAAELLFAGIGPFAAEPITENVIRGQYAAIPGGIIDASNAWAVPAPRDTYEPPNPPNTVLTLRTRMRCI